MPVFKTGAFNHSATRPQEHMTVDAESRLRCFQTRLKMKNADTSSPSYILHERHRRGRVGGRASAINILLAMSDKPSLAVKKNALLNVFSNLDLSLPV